jgi:hypothetical protein
METRRNTKGTDGHTGSLAVLSGHVLSASTALAYLAVGAAAVVGRSVAEAVATAFDWFRSRNGKPAHRAK